MDIKKTQEEIIQNKINHGFNTTDIAKEFCLRIVKRNLT